MCGSTMRSSSQNLSGRLEIAATVTVAGYFLASLLERFRRAFPEVQVIIHEHSRVVIERKIDNGQVDVGVVLVSNVKTRPDREMFPLISSQRRLWLPANHRFLEKESVTLSEIAQEPYIQLLIDEAAVTTANYWKTYGLRPKIVFSSESVEAVRSMIATGEGVTILSDMVYRPWSLEGDRIETRAVVEDVPSMDTGLLWRAGHTPSPVCKAFIDFCRMEYTSGKKIY